MSVAYGKPIYNADIIDGWDNELGVAIGISGLQPGQSVNSAFGNVTPSQMSGYIVQCIEMAIQYTKEALGVSDALLGNVDPNNKGAIVVATKNTQAPLENQKERIRQWTESQVLILLDMMANKYGTRNVLRKSENGERELVEFNFDELKEAFLNVKVEIGDASYFSEIAIQQTLDNLRRDQIIDVLQYLERMPDNSIPGKQELINELKAQQETQQDDTEQLKAKFESLPPEIQQQIMQLPQEQQAEAVRNA